MKPSEYFAAIEKQSTDARVSETVTVAATHSDTTTASPVVQPVVAPLNVGVDTPATPTPSENEAGENPLAELQARINVLENFLRPFGFGESD